MNGNNLANPANPATILSRAVLQLRMLCETLAFTPARVREALETVRSTMAPWAERPVHPQWASAISADHSAFEFSLTIHRDNPEVRMMIEAQGEEPTIAAQFGAALRLTEGLAARPGVCLERFEAVVDLFAADPSINPCGRFGLWHSVCFSNEGLPHWEAYFNPRIAGETQAWTKIDAAMVRLGLANVVREASREPPGYFALDLQPSDQPRVTLHCVRRNAARLLERPFRGPTELRYRPGMES